MRRPSRRLVGPLLVALALATPTLSTAAVASGPSAAPAERAVRAERATRAEAAELIERPERVDLGRARRGRGALAAVGELLPRVAATNDRTSAQLRRLLRTDRSMWLDRRGRLFVKDEFPGVAQAGGSRTAAAPYPNAQTFALHSRPGAAKVIYLDFDGQVVSGTAWNSSGVSTSPQPAFDLDGSPGSWSQAEHDAIQSIWQRVAEDYAPFDVDVTTQDPGTSALERSSSGDAAYGTRVLITPSSQAAGALCGGGCGGIAYIGTFGQSGNGYYQPAWVFPQALGQGTKAIAEAAAHEAGHNLGLNHDGTTSGDSYYSGHDDWAPIMGVGYYAPVTQWSRGEYAGANNTQDDLAVIAGQVPLVADEAGDTLTAARPLGSAAATTGLITTRGDVDAYSLTRGCSGPTTVTVTPAPTSPDLDARLRLYDDSGTLLASADPASAAVDYDVASGLSASLTQTLAAGSYYVDVDGVGVRTPSTGYSDYASLGAYTLSISPCDGGPVCTITGTDDDDVLVGTPGDDVICGLGGDDVLKGQGGDDLLLGGDGVDEVDYADATGPVTASLTTGLATGQGVDSLTGIESLDGSAYADTLDGDAGANVLAGKGGNDVVAGLAGDDRVYGGDGNDRLYLGDGDDAASGGAGTDTVSFGVAVNASLATGTATGQGRDTLSTIENLTGSGAADTLRGGSGGNVLTGGGGNDTLLGEAGNDTLLGGAGNDRLTGAAGTDRCDGGPGTDAAATCETRVSIP